MLLWDERCVGVCAMCGLSFLLRRVKATRRGHTNAHKIVLLELWRRFAFGVGTFIIKHFHSTSALEQNDVILLSERSLPVYFGMNGEAVNSLSRRLKAGW